MAVTRNGKYRKEWGTGDEAIAYTTSSALSRAGAALICFRVHLDAAGGAGDLTLTLDSANGSAYDVLYDTQEMTAVTDYIYEPTNDNSIVLMPGDKISVAWANAGGKTYGYEAIYKECNV